MVYLTPRLLSHQPYGKGTDYMSIKLHAERAARAPAKKSRAFSLLLAVLFVTGDRSARTVSPVPSSSALTLAQTVAAVAAVLIVGVILTPLFRRLRQPVVIAEIVAGIALGPSVLGLLPGDLTTRLFPAEVRPSLSAIAQVGILLFMFLVGWGMSLNEIRERRRAVVGVSLASLVLPFGAGIVLALMLYRSHSVVGDRQVSQLAFALFVGTAIAITAFPVLARIIIDHGLQRTPVGSVSLASAAVGDVLAWFLLALAAAVAVSAGPGQLLRTVGFFALFILVLTVLVRPALRMFVQRHGRNGRLPPSLLAVAAAGVFASGYLMQLIGIEAIFGAFFFGLVMPREPAYLLTATVRTPVEHVIKLLLPIFFVTTGLAVDLTRLGGAGFVELAAIVLVACASKFVGVTLAARFSGMSWRDARTVGVLMNTRGLTELIILNVGASMGVLDTEMFTMMVIMALLTTAMAGPLVPTAPGARDTRSDLDADVLHELEPAPSGQVGRGPGAEDR